MKPYGQKKNHKGPCVCEYCGKSGKLAIKRRERLDAKFEIAKAVAEQSKTQHLKLTKAEIKQMAKNICDDIKKGK